MVLPKTIAPTAAATTAGAHIAPAIASWIVNSPPATKQATATWVR